jgi:hypothetical protein
MTSLDWVDEIFSHGGTGGPLNDDHNEGTEDNDEVDQGGSGDSVSEEHDLCKSLASILVGILFGRHGINNCFQQRDYGDNGETLIDPASKPTVATESVTLLATESQTGLFCLELCIEGSYVNPLRSLISLLTELVERSWGNQSADVLEELQGELSPDDLLGYYLSPARFFADHLRDFTWSRRQAPLYWLLAAGSGGYAVYLYYQSLTKDTIYLLIDLSVDPALSSAQRRLFEIRQGDDGSSQAAQIVNDLSEFKRELLLVAPLWNPNLNDGVIINHAILWRITPYIPWQKKCKECWDKLVRGDYDWAHLAFHLWPERVIPKCTTDRSLAIAHGLEERLWQETNNGNWLPRQLSEADLQTLIAEHSNPAVKSALERFLAAPPPVAPTRTRASRSTRASGSSTPRRARGSAAVVDAEATRQVLLALTAAPSDGLAKTQIADLIGVEANALTAVIKQLKESGQIDQLGERRGARYVLSEQGRAVVAADAEGDA